MYTHMHTYTHMHIHTRTDKHMHTYSHTYIHMHTHTLTHIHTQVCAHMYTHMYTHTYTQTDTHKNTCAHTHIHIYTYTHIPLHTYIHTQVCAHMQMCLECTQTHTEHTPGLAGPRPGAEPLIPRPPSLAKHVLQEVTPREDTGALPRHAGTHLREVPAGAQALASALGLSSLPGPSTTHLVTLSPRNPSEPSHPVGAGSCLSYPRGDGFAQCPHLALETCGSARATAAQPRASTPVHHPGPWCPQPCDLCTLCEKSLGLHSPCVHREPNIRCPEKECYLGEGQAPRQAGTVSLHLCRVAVGAEQPVITATGARHRGPRPRGQAQVPEVQTHPAAETGALWARAGAGPGQGRVA